MQYIIVATRDIKANLFAQPQFVINKGHFLRSFQDEINRKDPQNLLYTHTEDFELYELGTYDDSQGSFQLHDKPIQLAVATSLKLTQ